MSDVVREIVIAEKKRGNIVVMSEEGLGITKLDDFLAQPAMGILYDLNRLPEVVLTFIEDPKWVNDYAVAMVITALKNQLDAEREAHAKEVADLLTKIIYACNNSECSWVGAKDKTIHPKHSPHDLLCPDCRETVELVTVSWFTDLRKRIAELEAETIIALSIAVDFLQGHYDMESEPLREIVALLDRLKRETSESKINEYFDNISQLRRRVAELEAQLQDEHD